jgi:hypothetical protein
LAASAATPPKDLYQTGEILRSATCRRASRVGLANATPAGDVDEIVVPTWPIGEDDVLVHAMAAASTTTCGPGSASRSPARRPQESNPHRRVDASGTWAVAPKEALEGRRRGHVHCNVDDGDDAKNAMAVIRCCRRRSASGLRDPTVVRALLPRAVTPVDAR